MAEPARFLVLHEADCGCADRRPGRCATVDAVMVFLWGRAVRRHLVVHAPQCWRFGTGDLATVERVLRVLTGALEAPEGTD